MSSFEEEVGAGGGGEIPWAPAGSARRERSCGDGVSRAGAALHPGTANIVSCFWQQTSAPHVSSKKREWECFYRAGNRTAEATYGILKSGVNGGAERGKGRAGWSAFLHLVPDVRKGEQKCENLDSLCL